VTEGLRERLLVSAPARIINTASAAHEGAALDFEAADPGIMTAKFVAIWRN
jgi:hypothetical protein